MLLAIAFWRNGIVKLMTWAFKLAGKMHIVKDPEKRIVDTTKTIDDAYNEMRYMMKKPRLFARSIAVTFVQLLEFFAISYVIMRGLGCDGDFLTVIFVPGVRVYDFVVAFPPQVPWVLPKRATRFSSARFTPARRLSRSQRSFGVSSHFIFLL